MIKKIIYFLLIAFILFDLAFSFYQYLHFNLDGDVVVSVLPGQGMEPLLSDPFGLKVIMNNEYYQNPNRFFGHWAMKHAFSEGTWSLQNFFEPLQSVYLTSAISKFIMHLLILYILSSAISGTFKFYDFYFVLSAAILSPLFQANGYARYMAIIDPSITYSFFYAFPSIFLLGFLLPLSFRWIHKTNHNHWLFWTLIYIPCGIIACFSGALNPGVFCVISLLVFIYFYKENYRQLAQYNLFLRLFASVSKLPKFFWFYFVPVSLVSVYSFFIGTHNSNNDLYPMPLVELYRRLPIGFLNQFFYKLAFPMLFLILIINILIFKKVLISEFGEKFIRLVKWFLLFSFIYILLLPLGGYRDYRPNVLRYDSIIPITLGLFFIIGLSTIYIIRTSKFKLKPFYIGFIILILFLFESYDKFKDYTVQEKSCINTICTSKEKVVKLPANCSIINWHVVKNPEQSKDRVEMMKYWNICKEDKLFYQTNE